MISDTLKIDNQEEKGQVSGASTNQIILLSYIADFRKIYSITDTPPVQMGHKEEGRQILGASNSGAKIKCCLSNPSQDDNSYLVIDASQMEASSGKKDMLDFAASTINSE